jgi:DNA-binding NarL/FixJ family response regulator
MSTRKRFAIADDHEFWRNTLIEIINKDIPDADIVVEASNGIQLIEKLSTLENESAPSLVILDLHMPVMNGFETARWLHLNRPEILIVALSLSQDEKSIIRLLEYGVLGFMQKNINGPDLIVGIQTVLKGEYYFSPFKNPLGKDLHLEIDSILKTKDILRRWDSLSQQAKQFVGLCCSDMRYKEMAKIMQVDATVIAYLASKTFAHFEVTNRISLVLLAYKNNLI